MTEKRVVITGSGNVSGYGIGTDALMHGLRNGHSCVNQQLVSLLIPGSKQLLL